LKLLGGLPGGFLLLPAFQFLLMLIDADLVFCDHHHFAQAVRIILAESIDGFHKVGRLGRDLFPFRIDPLSDLCRFTTQGHGEFKPVLIGDFQRFRVPDHPLYPDQVFRELTTDGRHGKHRRGNGYGINDRDLVSRLRVFLF